MTKNEYNASKRLSLEILFPTAIALSVAIVSGISIAEYSRQNELRGETCSAKITQINQARQRNALTSKVMKEYDTNNDGQLSLEELGAMQSALVFSKGQPTFQQYLSTYSNDQLKTLLEAKK